MANKVKYGFQSLYYAVATIATDGSATYSTPVAWPGAISISLDAEGDQTPLRADNMDYWVGVANNGYSGDLETALVPDSFRKDVMGELTDSNGAVIEAADVQPKQFALLFQFQGDEKATRHVLYNCTATRPSVAGQTTADTVEAGTETVTIKAGQIYVPAISHNVTRARLTQSTSSTYTSWFTAVHVPAALSA